MAAPTAPPTRPGRARPRLGVLLLALGLVVVVVVAAAGVAGRAWWQRAQVSTVGELDFTRPLAIPPLAEPTVDAAGRLTFDLTATAGTTELKPGLRTPTLGYDGTFGGPTLRASRGDEVRVRVRNEMDEVTSTHWHGMSLPARADGGPHQPVGPGETWEPSWTVDQPAATLWYHPHPHGRTEDQVHRGLAGMFIVDDPESDALDLPRTYGVDDIPVMVTDRSFTDDGRFEQRAPLGSQSGALGDELLVNGTWDPHLDVTTERVRLRLLNTSPARVFAFGLDDGRPLDLVATDGGLLGAPVPLERIRLSPGERAEVVVRMEPGERTVLRSEAPDLGLNPLSDRAEGGDDRFDVLKLRAAPELEPSPEVPDRLADLPPPDEAASERTRSFRLEGDSRIDGERMAADRVDQVVRAGAIETWEVEGGGMPHSFHVHDVQVRVLSIGGEAPPPELSGWKDTVFLAGDDRYRLLIRFSDHVDPGVPYMYHCHLLRHEDRGMMGQLTVTEDGEGPRTIEAPPEAHGDHGG